MTRPSSGIESSTTVSPAPTVDLVRQELEYGGLRLKTNTTIDGVRVRVVIDIGFGDAVEPVEIVSRFALPLSLRPFSTTSQSVA